MSPLHCVQNVAFSKILLLLLACNVLAVWGAKRISIYKAWESVDLLNTFLLIALGIQDFHLCQWDKESHSFSINRHMSTSILDVLKWAGSNVSLILSSIKTGVLCLNVCFPYALECVNYRAWAARKQRLDECFELQVSRISLACTVCDFFFTYTLW